MSSYARQGFRVIAIAGKNIPTNSLSANHVPKPQLRMVVEKDLTFYGLVVLANKPKETVRYPFLFQPFF